MHSHVHLSTIVTHIFIGHFPGKPGLPSCPLTVLTRVLGVKNYGWEALPDIDLPVSTMAVHYGC